MNSNVEHFLVYEVWGDSDGSVENFIGIYDTYPEAKDAFEKRKIIDIECANEDNLPVQTDAEECWEAYNVGVYL